MTYKEADTLMATVEKTGDQLRLNKQLNVAQAVDIVRACLMESIEKGDGEKGIPDWLEKRVLQVSRNRCRG